MNSEKSTSMSDFSPVPAAGYPQARLPWAQRSFYMFETVCRLAIENGPEAAAMLSAGVAAAGDVQACLNIYEPSSELSRLCRRQAGEPVKVSGLLFQFLTKLLAFSQKSPAAFAPCLGPLIRLWEQAGRADRLPDDAAIRRLLPSCVCQDITLDPAGPFVTLPRDHMLIHPGAAGKGFALDLAKARLDAYPFHCFCLNFGGNLCLNGGNYEPESGRFTAPWRIALEDPRRPGSPFYILTLDLTDPASGLTPGMSSAASARLEPGMSSCCFISTSSAAEHFYEIGGRKYSHILNPANGRPAESDILSATLITPCGTDGDILSTIACVLGSGPALRFFASLQEEGMELSYIFLLENGTVLQG